MGTVIDTAIARWRTVSLILFLIFTSGVVAYNDIPKESNPDVNIPIIYVSMSHDGISPEDAERLLIRPMEQKLRLIEGLREVRSTGYEGGANIIMEFEAGFNADAAISDVRSKVDSVQPELPVDTEEPTVQEVNFSLFPVIIVALSTDIPERTLLKLANSLKEKLEDIESVLRVEIVGKRDEMVEILIDPVRVESYGLSPVDAVSTVMKSNLLIAAGAQDTGLGRFSVKVPGLFESVRDIMTLPVATVGDSVVVLGDIGEIRRSFKDPDSFARINGQQALALEITKRTGANLIETIESVQDVVSGERMSWSSELESLVTLVYMQDQSREVSRMLLDLENSIITAILLVMIIVISALGLRSAILVGIAIPGSFLMAIFVLFIFGVTINVVVLFSLILAVGMLVDGTIVVTEYADRIRSEGTPRLLAYGIAAKRMSWPIIASTATTLAAFLPLVFWPGVVGEFMKYLPITLLIILSASLLMALIFIPTLGSHLGHSGLRDLDAKNSVISDDSIEKIQSSNLIVRLYLLALRVSLNNSGKVLVLAALLLVFVQIAYAEFGKGVEFFPEVEPEFAKLQIRAQGNLSIIEQDRLIKEVESRILNMKEISSMYTRTGKSERSEESEDIIGSITLEFVNWSKRRTSSHILRDVNERTKDLAGLIIDYRKSEAGPPVGKPIQIELSSREPGLLQGAVDHILSGLHELGGFTNIEDSSALPGIEWKIQVDRSQAAKYGVDIDMVGRSVQMITTGVKFGEFRPDDVDEEIEIRARYPTEFRTIQQLDAIRIFSKNQNVPLTNFVSRKTQKKIGNINRVNARRVMFVKSNVAEDKLADDQVQQIEKWLADNPLHSEIEITFRGEDEEQRKAETFLLRAFAVALFIMAIILVTQFNSFYSAFLILSAVIMSTIGVFIGLLITQQPFGIVMTGIGVVALAGIVVNNNIVLIDTFDRLKKTKKSIFDAILETGVQRLRPVLLTTGTTVLGLMPMVLGVNIDFIDRSVTYGAPSMQWWQQLSTAIVFGLGFATILTLIVTPCSLMIRQRITLWFQK